MRDFVWSFVAGLTPLMAYGAGLVAVLPLAAALERRGVSNWIIAPICLASFGFAVYATYVVTGQTWQLQNH